jgi:hypothetical protein
MFVLTMRPRIRKREHDVGLPRGSTRWRRLYFLMLRWTWKNIKFASYQMNDIKSRLLGPRQQDDAGKYDGKKVRGASSRDGTKK